MIKHIARSSPEPLECVFQFLVSRATSSAHKALPSPVASLGINKDRSLRVRQAQAVRAEWSLLKFMYWSFTTACIWSPPLLSVTQWALQGLRWFLTSHTVHPCTLQVQLMERCVPAPQPFPSEATVCVACPVLRHAAASHESGGARRWAAGCSPAHRSCTAFARAHLLQPVWKLL